MAQLVELPSGLILNLDLVESIRPRNPKADNDTNLAYVGGRAYEISNDDLAYLKKLYVTHYAPTTLSKW